MDGKRRWAPGEISVSWEGVSAGPPRFFASKPIHEFFLTVPVCRACNNSWMSQLEVAARPVLTPLIEGTKFDLDGAQVETVMRWIGKVAVAYEQDDPLSAHLHPSQIRDVLNGRVPRWSRFWLGRWEDEGEVMLRHSPFQVLERASRQRVGWAVTTFVALGRVVLAVQSLNAPLNVFPILEPVESWTRLGRDEGVRYGLPASTVNRRAIEDETTYGTVKDA